MLCLIISNLEFNYWFFFLSSNKTKYQGSNEIRPIEETSHDQTIYMSKKTLGLNNVELSIKISDTKSI